MHCMCNMKKKMNRALHVKRAEEEAEESKPSKNTERIASARI